MREAVAGSSTTLRSVTPRSGSTSRTTASNSADSGVATWTLSPTSTPSITLIRIPDSVIAAAIGEEIEPIPRSTGLEPPLKVAASIAGLPAPERPGIATTSMPIEAARHVTTLKSASVRAADLSNRAGNCCSACRACSLGWIQVRSYGGRGALNECSPSSSSSPDTCVRLVKRLDEVSSSHSGTLWL